MPLVLLSFQGDFTLVSDSPGRCPGLWARWPFRPLCTPLLGTDGPGQSSKDLRRPGPLGALRRLTLQALELARSILGELSARRLRRFTLEELSIFNFQLVNSSARPWSLDTSSARPWSLDTSRTRPLVNSSTLYFQLSIFNFQLSIFPVFPYFIEKNRQFRWL